MEYQARFSQIKTLIKFLSINISYLYMYLLKSRGKGMAYLGKAIGRSEHFTLFNCNQIEFTITHIKLKEKRKEIKILFSMVDISLEAVRCRLFSVGQACYFFMLSHGVLQASCTLYAYTLLMLYMYGCIQIGTVNKNMVLSG